ncbi:hypothetical protein KEM55_005125 [Ascosphaera atra]|nr:hypothetical protein KEM55_005125 [Ascosphaera atra]
MDSIRRLPCLQAQARKQFGLSPASSCPLPFLFSQGQARCHPRAIRAFSTKSAAAQDKSAPLASQKPPFAAEIKGPPPLSLMPLPVLLRSLMVTSFMTSPRLLDMAMPIMDKLSTTQSWILSPDKNPALKGAVRFGFYDHFAGGADRKEVRSTIGNLRGMGYHGAILSFAKEIVAQHALESEEADADSTVAQWKEDNLQTLDMLGPDDVLALKFSGAGPSLVNSLRSGGDPPAHFKKALHEVCDASLLKGTRVFVDAEQQCFQDTVDKWTLDLMRKYNVPEKKTPNGCLVYTTLQAYLKKAPGRLREFLRRPRALVT